VGSVLLPIYLGYLWPWLRMRVFGAAIAPEVWRRKHVAGAAAFYRLAVRMKGGLIKVGQILSTRVDLLPPEWTSGLSRLQDEVGPAPARLIRRRLLVAYGKPAEEVFERFDTAPIAAASFGQVHRARTEEGEEVALKIKYPGIEEKLVVDLWLFGIAVRMFNVFLPNISLTPVLRESRRALSTELDYEQEAAFTREVWGNFVDVEGTTIPRVVDALTTRDVICTTFFEGKKIIHPSVLERPAAVREALLRRLLETWIQMMYVDGVFQSDPHPGNLLVRFEDDDTPHLCVVDFGQVKILTPEFHQKLVAAIMAFAMNNDGMFIDALVNLGVFPDSDKDRLGPLITDILERIRTLNPAENPTVVFTDVRDEVRRAISEVQGIVIPQELVLYGRTIGLLAGVTRQLAPEVNALAIAQPMLAQALLGGGPKERTPEAAAAVAS
jgi:ubiquinone biosynthesis protein